MMVIFMRYFQHIFIIIAMVFLINSIMPSIGQARILDYQIRRLVLLKTKCVLISIEKNLSPESSLSFLVKCENVSFYPKGIKVICSDPDLETSCEIKTAIKKFKNLNLLKRSVNQNYISD